MNKILIALLLLLNSALLFGNDNELEKAKKKYNKYNSISYTVIAHYPNPETDQIKIFSQFFIVNNFKNESFEFYSKLENSEEYYKDGVYTYVDNAGISLYKYENEQNQINTIQNSRLVQYGPTFLLKNKWKFENNVVIEGKRLSHYSLVESLRKFNEKTIKVEFHIYISKNHTITMFERKSYVDNEIGQTVTLEFTDYKFSKKDIVFKHIIPDNYALKYFERSELKPLDKGTKAPNFIAEDLNKKPISSEIFFDNNILLLFSSTNCGASKEVFDFMNSKDFKLPKDYKFINAYTSDKQENVRKYFNNSTLRFPIIADKKKIETLYQISGYPVMYYIDKNAVILEVFDGYDQIIKYLKELH